MEKNNKKGGWRENADPTCVNKKGKPVARRHHNVAARKEFENTLRTPYVAASKDEDEQFADKVIEGVQENRTESAKAKDESKTAKDEGNKDDAEDLVEWVREPGKSDLEGVDTKNNNSKKHEDEED